MFYSHDLKIKIKRNELSIVIICSLWAAYIFHNRCENWLWMSLLPQVHDNYNAIIDVCTAPISHRLFSTISFEFVLKFVLSVLLQRNRHLCADKKRDNIQIYEYSQYCLLQKSK